MIMDLKALSKKLVEKALKLGADEAEVYISSARSEDIEVLEQRIESVDIKDETGLGLRIFSGKKLGFSYTTELSDYAIDQAAEKAIENSRYSEEDENNSLPHPAEQQKKLALSDKEIDDLTSKEKIKLALSIEKSAYSFDKRIKKTEKSSFQTVNGRTIITNSNGTSTDFSENICGGGIEIISEENGLMENGFHSKHVRKLKDFNAELVGRTAAQRAVELLGAKPISPQKLDLIMSPRVATQFLNAASSLFSSDFVQKGKSALADKLGKTVASSLITLIDDGTLPGGLATSPFDAEGTPTRETILINKGNLNTFLFNTYTANKGKANSTGNAARGGFAGIPVVGTTNLYIKPGDSSEDKLIGSIQKGFYLTRVMGMHTVNPISAEFSVGAAGILIENGKKTTPVRGVTIAGNLIELLKSIIAVGNNLEFTGSTGSPSLLIKEISISGQ